MHQIAKWHPSYSVFIKELDEHHKKLIDLLNELYNAYLLDVHKEKVSEIIAELRRYTVEHFGLEEKYFNQFNFEGSQDHIKEHAFFIEKVKSFEADYQKNSTLASLQIINFLLDWITNHILNVDKEYINCFKQAGLK